MSASVSRPALSLAAILAFSFAGPADAESFLKSLARQAAQRAVEAAAANASNPPQQQQQAAAAPEAAAEGDGEAPAAEAEAPETATTGPAPWPMNAGARGVRYPADLKLAPEYAAQKKAFEDFSKVSCNDCEGGYSYDAWAPHFIRTDGSWKAWEKTLGALALGQSLTWQGSQAKGTITVTGEEPINGWPCKQLKWTLKKPAASAERLGLICYARESSYSGKETWNIVL